MSDETFVPEEQEPAPAFVGELKSEVINKVTGSVVYERTVDTLVEQTIEKYSGLLVKVIDKVTETRTEINKIRAKSPGVDESGAALPGVLPKDDFEKRKKLIEKANKLEKAAQKAIDNSDWKGLEDALNKAG